MRWHTFLKILYNRPDILDGAFQMSFARAEAAQVKEGFAPFAEMVRKAKLASIAPAADWAAVDAVVARHSKPSLRALWNKPAQRGWAVACLFILLLAGFLFSPPGRALAAYVERIFLQVVDHGLEFVPSSYQEGVVPVLNGPIEHTETEYPDLDAVEAAFDRQLLRLMGDGFALERVTLYDSTLSGILLVAEYKTPQGHSVSLHQQWRKSTISATGFNPEDEVWEETLWDGTTLYCLISSDHLLNMMGAWRDEILFIYADDVIPSGDIVKAVGVKD